MPVKCYRKAKKKGGRYTTCKDEATGNQLRGGAKPVGRPKKPKQAPAPRRSARLRSR